MDLTIVLLYIIINFVFDTIQDAFTLFFKKELMSQMSFLGEPHL
jgi:hypothetical protein